MVCLDTGEHSDFLENEKEPLLELGRRKNQVVAFFAQGHTCSQAPNSQGNIGSGYWGVRSASESRDSWLLAFAMLKPSFLLRRSSITNGRMMSGIRVLRVTVWWLNMDPRGALMWILSSFHEASVVSLIQNDEVAPSATRG